MTTTARQQPPHMVHSGFNDLMNLVASTPSRLGVNIASNPRSYGPISYQKGYGNIGSRYGDGLPAASAGRESYHRLGNHAPSRGIQASRGGRARGLGRGGRVGVVGGREEWKNVELKKRRIDKRMIGPPMDFRHIFHASTFEEATELLLRWSMEGVGDKLGGRSLPSYIVGWPSSRRVIDQACLDPAWAYPIKELVKARAREQQARAVAAVVEATARSRNLGDVDAKDLQPPGTLRVVNGLPSSIYSTTNTSLLPSTTIKTGQRLPQSSKDSRSTGQTSISPILANASTPNLIANFPAGYFDGSSTAGLRTPTSPLSNPFASPPETPLIPASNAPSTPPRKRGTQPLQLRKKSGPALPTTAEVNGKPPSIDDNMNPLGNSAEVLLAQAPPTPSSPPRMKKDSRPSAKDVFTPLPFRVIKPSLPTLEKAMSVALFFEQYYHALLRPPAIHPGASTPGKPVHPGNYVLNRARRLAALEATFALPENRCMSEAEKESRRDELAKEENRILRERRKKVDVKGFELGRVIGHGAFGVVRIARERESGRLVAMKQLRKADMLRKSQEGHVKAEKDLLAAAASQALSPSISGDSLKPSWIVQLYYAFQDPDHLYLVLEFMGGGDLLNLLVERDTFPEEMTKFYVAEMVLALEETHSLGFIHRDIKPDNFLFTKEGHIRVSDFGLATDLHWAHDTSYYEHQRLALLKKHGVDLEYPSVKTKRMKKEDVEKIMGKEWMDQGKGILTWREGNRKKLAYSVCGTNSYMAPEVIRGQGYGFSCDWWSLGIIMYESLYGYPPFVSSSRHVTRQKILNWRTTLKFPPKPRLSPECIDLMLKLICEPEDRLGTTPHEKSSVLTSSNKGSTIRGGFKGLGHDGADMIKNHAWFEGVDWDNMHKQTPPYHPDLYAEDDTRHFDDDIPDEPLAPANGAAVDATKDPLLRNKAHGAHLLEIRKERYPTRKR
ncbi:AGC/NDR/NDR protein kinase [Kwoniella heveanensis BCC8398]|uniref:non-specific serine/threonine protein kinase n=1 Tax=Kwoniella heveanensis BCC8398 TaxID=1296120 RepID=A0A1B9GTR8_9TREE|nr:AGC/NDR/NDR protein kinase [Kwoniella heveanensis BCC8398]